MTSQSSGEALSRRRASCCACVVMSVTCHAADVLRGGHDNRVHPNLWSSHVSDLPRTPRHRYRRQPRPRAFASARPRQPRSLTRRPRAPDELGCASCAAPATRRPAHPPRTWQHDPCSLQQHVAIGPRTPTRSEGCSAGRFVGDRFEAPANRRQLSSVACASIRASIAVRALVTGSSPPPITCRSRQGPASARSCDGTRLSKEARAHPTMREDPEGRSAGLAAAACRRALAGGSDVRVARRARIATACRRSQSFGTGRSLVVGRNKRPAPRCATSTPALYSHRRRYPATRRASPHPLARPDRKTRLRVDTSRLCGYLPTSRWRCATSFVVSSAQGSPTP
jgi:hypothetical protein